MEKSIFYIYLNEEIKKYEIQGQYAAPKIDESLENYKNDENNNIIIFEKVDNIIFHSK